MSAARSQNLAREEARLPLLAAALTPMVLSSVVEVAHLYCAQDAFVSDLRVVRASSEMRYYGPTKEAADTWMRCSSQKTFAAQMQPSTASQLA